jgi:hypothetical protein
MFAISEFFQFLKKEPSLFGMYQAFLKLLELNLVCLGILREMNTGER